MNKIISTFLAFITVIVGLSGAAFSAYAEVEPTAETSAALTSVDTSAASSSAVTSIASSQVTTDTESASDTANTTSADSTSAEIATDTEPVDAKVSVPVAVNPNFCWHKADELAYFEQISAYAISVGHSITRAQFSYIGARCLGVNTTGFTEQACTDIEQDRWYSTSCNWATKIGAFGDNPSEFNPKKKINADDIKSTVNTFVDKNKIFNKNINDVSHSAGEWFSYVKTFYSYLKDSSQDALNTIKTKRAIASEIDAYSLYFASEHAEIEVGAAQYMGVARSDGESDSVTYSSSNPEVADYCYGDILYAFSCGYTTLTATSSDGLHKVSCIVYVAPSSLLTIDDMGKAVRNFDPSKPTVALTFDDGPGIASEQILDTMEKYNVTATFFEQGKNVYYYPDIVKREVALGCEVGNHSYDHANLSKLSIAHIKEEIDTTNQAILSVGGITSTLLRPPYGARSKSLNACANMPEILWRVDTLDWKYSDVTYILNTVKDEVKDGDIILMHSVHEVDGDAIEPVVVWLLSKGYQLVTVSELALGRGYTLENGVAYSHFPIQ